MSRFIASALVFLLAIPLAGEEGQGSLSLGLQSDCLESRLILGEGSRRLVMNFEADGGGGLLKAGLEVPGFLLGPALLGGLPAFLHNPCSAAQSSPSSPPADLDSSLCSTLSGLALGPAGPLAALVLARGGSLSWAHSLPGPGAAQGIWTLPESLALGVVTTLGGSPERPRLSLAGFLMDGGWAKPQDAWTLEGSPAKTGPRVLLGFSFFRGIPGARILLEGALSLGPLASPGQALRLEVQGRTGGLELGLRAGLATREFASLLPSPGAEALSLGVDGKLGLGRGGQACLALRASSPGLGADPGSGDLECRDRTARLSLLIPSGVESLVLIRPALALGLSGGLPSFSTGLELEKRGPSLEWVLELEARPAQFALALRAGPPPSLALALEPELSLKLAWEGEGPFLLGLELGLDLGRAWAGDLRLELAFEELDLGLRGSGTESPGPSLSLTWKTSLGPEPALDPQASVTAGDYLP